MKPKKYEGSALDIKRDKAEAKRRGTSMKSWMATAEHKEKDRRGQKEFNRKAKRGA
jgi:hypothetical protein